MAEERRREAVREQAWHLIGTDDQNVSHQLRAEERPAEAFRVGWVTIEQDFECCEQKGCEVGFDRGWYMEETQSIRERPVFIEDRKVCIVQWYKLAMSFLGWHSGPQVSEMAGTWVCLERGPPRLGSDIKRGINIYNPSFRQLRQIILVEWFSIHSLMLFRRTIPLCLTEH